MNKSRSSSCLLFSLQDSDNPDLRDRGYIYWRLLSTDPVAAKEVVLAEKPLISEETDLIEPTLLEELICHIGTLASVYHKPPSAFVEGSRGVQHKRLPGSAGSWVMPFFLIFHREKGFVYLSGRSFLTRLLCFTSSLLSVTLSSSVELCISVPSCLLETTHYIYLLYLSVDYMEL